MGAERNKPSIFKNKELKMYSTITFPNGNIIQFRFRNELRFKIIILVGKSYLSPELIEVLDDCTETEFAEILFELQD